MNQILQVAISGMDGSGKTILVKEFCKATNWKYVLFDRGTVDCFAYNRLAKRGEDESLFIESFKTLAPRTLFVILTASPDVIRARMDVRDDHFLPFGTVEDNVRAFREAYDVFHAIDWTRVIEIDNSQMSVAEEVETIKKMIDWIEGGNHVGVTREIGSFVSTYSVEDYKSYCVNPPYDLILKSDDPREWKYINSLTHELTPNIYYDYAMKRADRVIEELKRDSASRRGFINYSEMGFEYPCVVYATYRIRGSELLTTVHVRSNDVDKGFPFDLAWQSFITEFIAREVDVTPGRVTWMCDSFHRYD
jgi:thymidylate kinase